MSAPAKAKGARGRKVAADVAAPAEESPRDLPAPPPPPPLTDTAASKTDQAEQHYKQGNLYIQEKKVTLAIAALKKCLALNPKHGRAYRSLGVAYYMLGREKSAVQAYSKFVELAPDHRDVPKVKKIIADYHQRHP